MSGDSWQQLALLLLEVTIVAILLLSLFRVRHRFGLFPLFGTLGVFQYLQVMLSLSLYVEIVPGLSVSPGSVVLFSGSLFALLLVYIREDPAETRTLVYGLFAANVSLSGLSLLFGLHLDSPLVRNIYDLPVEIFRLDLRIMAVGTLALLLDMFLLMACYQALTKVIERNLFARIFATLGIVLAMDTVVFVVGAFAGKTIFWSVLLSGLVAKLGAAFLYSGFLAAYLRWIEPTAGWGPAQSLADVVRMVSIQDHSSVLLIGSPKDPILRVLPEARFVSVLSRRLAIAGRAGVDVDLLVIAVKGYAEIEKRLGREEGIAALRYLVAVVRSALGTDEILARYENDALALLVVGRDVDALQQNIHRSLTEALTKLRPSTKVLDLRVGIGLARFPNDGHEGIELLRLAASRANSDS